MAVELEVMAKKMDRFGWDRDMGSAVHDRLITDWMDALHDFPLDEIKAACRDWVLSMPRKMPNEGDIVKLIQSRRKRQVQAYVATQPAPQEPPKERISADRAAQILAEAGYAPKKFS